jgi:hypothetical protein
MAVASEEDVLESYDGTTFVRRREWKTLDYPASARQHHQGALAKRFNT